MRKKNTLASRQSKDTKRTGTGTFNKEDFCQKAEDFLEKLRNIRNKMYVIKLMLCYKALIKYV